MYEFLHIHRNRNRNTLSHSHGTNLKLKCISPSKKVRFTNELSKAYD